MKIDVKNLRTLIWAITIILLIVGLYALWNKLTTPRRLPLQNIKPGQTLNVEFVTQLGGSVSSGQTKPLVVNENLVYVGIGPRLAILDISDLSNIYLVGQSDIIPDPIGEVVFVGNYVFIAPGAYGYNNGTDQKLHIVDVSNPTQPQYQGAYAPPDKYVRSVYAFGNYLYMIAREINSDKNFYYQYLYILDISNPTQPAEVSHIDLGENISDIVVSGNSIYVITNGPGNNQGGLHILDSSDKREPKEIDTLYPSESGYSVSISGNYLYLLGPTKEKPWMFRILDISNSWKPFDVAVREQYGVDLISVYQNMAYFLSLGDQKSISFVDISDPKKPRDIATHEFDGRVVAIQENIAFVIDANRLVLFDLSDPLNPVNLGCYIGFTPDEGLSELYFNGTKGVVPVWNDMYILDFSDPVSPVIANRYSISQGYGVERMHGDFVYMDANKEIQALDISDPARPAIIWRHDGYDKNDQPFILATAEKYAYVINPVDGFYVYDIVDPANPKLISHQSELKGFDGFDDFAFTGKYLYILDGRDLHILDASDPTAIAEVGTYKFSPNQSGYRSIKIIGDLAFLDNSLYDGTEPAKLTILNISDPEKPSLITSYYWGEYSAINGYSIETIFINSYDGLHVVDFSDPKNPRETGYYGLDQDYGAGPSSVALGQNNLVYVISYPNGLYVLRYLPPNK